MTSKKIIIDAMSELYDKRLISILDGNISYKPKNSSMFYLTGGSVKKNKLNHEQIIEINFDKDKRLKYNKSHLYLPSREIYMHSYLQTDPLYKDKDTFIIHAHPRNILSYMGLITHRELKTIKYFFPEINVGDIGNNVKYHHAGTNCLANECYNNLLNNSIIGLKNHGSLSIGEDIDNMIEEIETLEYYTSIVMK